MTYKMNNEVSIAPKARIVTDELEIHGIKIQDDYAWLKAHGWPDKITDKEVLSYLEEENKYYDNFMSPLSDLKEEFFQELKGRIKLTDQSPYTKKDDYFYYTRTEADKDYAIYCRKKGDIGNKEEILLDVNKLAEGKNFTSLGSFSISPDHKLLAYSVDFTGGEKYTIYVFDLESQQFLLDEIPDTIGSVIWHEDRSGFFYVPSSQNWRHDKVKFHRLGSKHQDDKILFYEPDPLYSVGISKSSSKEYLFIDVSGHDSTEIYFIDLKDKNLALEPKLIKNRKEAVIYSVDHAQEYFYQHTNDDAKNFQILRTKAASYNRNQLWEIYIPENDNYLSGFDITKDFLLLNYVNKGLPELLVLNLLSQEKQFLTFPENAYTASIYSTNFIENDIRVNYSSLARPYTVYNYDFDLNKLTVIKVTEIPSGFNPEEYNVERVLVSTDGVEVPVSLFYKKSLFKKDGSNPLYLYGYGSYGLGVAPLFRNSGVSLVDRGFVFAIAHIRGGDDLGHDWYEAAKFLNKKRTFSDFIAAADYLVKTNYTSSGNIIIAGGSAGGMLIGNVINQRPELFKAAIAHVPFVDVLNTMLDESLPLTPGEYKEWGNPKEKDYFDYIKSYSPYDNVSAQFYPHLFVTAGLSDPRVGYWEAAKWVAKLRQKKTDSNVIIFKTNMDFGHQGASGRFDYLKETAEELAFIINIYGIK